MNGLIRLSIALIALLITPIALRRWVKMYDKLLEHERREMEKFDAELKEIAKNESEENQNEDRDR
jgi:hypothetical protein